MKCPYAVVKGLLTKKVYCSIVGKIVDHKKYGCLSAHYIRCEIYRKAIEDRSEEERKEKTDHDVIAPEKHEVSEEGSDELERMVNESVKKALTYADPRKGVYPDTCYDCLYYSPTTGLCLLLRKKVENPESPPCKRGK